MQPCKPLPLLVQFIEFLHVTTLFRFVACPFFRSVITLMYEVCSKSIRPFSLSPIRYEQTARAKRGCTHTHSRVIVKRFRPIRHSYLSV